MANAVKVLIVEDEPHALMGLAELISGWGYRTETARDGMEGWEKILAWEPAIVVTDLKMPRLGGIEVLRRLKADERTRMIPVVMLTSSAEEQDVVESYKLGVNSYLVKPVDFAAFSSVIAQTGLYWAVMNRIPNP